MAVSFHTSAARQPDTARRLKTFSRRDFRVVAVMQRELFRKILTKRVLKD